MVRFFRIVTGIFLAGSLVLPQLLHGFLAKIAARIAAHPAGAGRRGIDHSPRFPGIAGMTIPVILAPLPDTRQMMATQGVGRVFFRSGFWMRV